jgi:hypothetical protein
MNYLSCDMTYNRDKDVNKKVNMFLKVRGIISRTQRQIGITERFWGLYSSGSWTMKIKG